MPEGSMRLFLMAATVAIHLGLALVIGCQASRAWMWRRSSAWSAHVAHQAVTTSRLGFALGLAGVGASAWLQAMDMSDSSPLAAGPAFASLIGNSHFGHAWAVGLAAWLTAATLSTRLATARRTGAFLLALVAIAVFTVTRSVVSHAGSQGDFTIDVAADWVHLVLVCLWVGIVLVGARLTLPGDLAPPAERADAARWVSLMSTTATAAIVGIGATGLFKVWRGWTVVGSLAQYVGSDYGKALAAKLALVAFAAALGGLNRFVVLPRLFDGLAAKPAPAGGHWRRRLLLILRVEAATLLLVLCAAAVLSTSELPGST
jgi:putative copper resistance protein D